MRADPPAVGGRLVDRVPHERVPEAIAPRHVGARPAARRPAARPARPAPPPRSSPAAAIARSRSTGSPATAAPCASARPASLKRRDLLLQRARDRARHARPGGLGGDAAARRVLARELLQEERVAAARLVDLAAHRAGDRRSPSSASASANDSAPSGCSITRAVALGGRQRGGEQRPHRRGPERQREQRPRPAAGAAADAATSSSDASSAQCRSSSTSTTGWRWRQRLQQRAHRAVRAVALVLQAGRDAPDGRQHRRQLGQLVAHEPLEPVDAEERRVLGQRVLPDAERQLALELRRAPAEHEVSAARAARAELVEQPRLADPALAARTRSPRPGAARALQRVVDRRELRAPPEELPLPAATTRQI